MSSNVRRERKQVDPLVERLEGWWFGMSSGPFPAPVLSMPVLAIEQRVDELREEFKRSALPVDYASRTLLRCCGRTRQAAVCQAAAED